MKTKKIISFCLSATLACGSVLTLTSNTYSDNFTNPIVASAAISNYIGDGLSWEYDSSSRTLTISGTGKMKNLNGINSIPWRVRASEIKKVIISDGVESIGNYAFAMFSNLKYIEIPNSVQEIGNYVFYNSGLEAVEMNSTTRIIHESAFKNTPYYRNKFTTERNSYMSIGSAKDMTGRQLVVNIFPAELRGMPGVATQVDGDYIVDHNKEYVIYKDYNFYKYLKSNLQYTFLSKWGYNGTLECVSNINEINAENPEQIYAKSLDSINYSSLVDADYTSFATDATTDSIKDWYVTSPEIQETLNTVNDALEDLESQAANYDQYLEFVMSPETNFYYTYNNWDDTVQYDFKVMGHDVNVEPIKGSYQEITKWTNTDIILKQMSEKVGLDFMISKEQINRDEYTSPLTNQLMSEYDVDGVIYIVHIPGKNDFGGITSSNSSTDLKDFANNSNFIPVTDEHCLIKNENKLTIMHEICHLYGAADYYIRGQVNLNNVSSGLVYTNNYYTDKNADLMCGTLMNSNSNEPKIGADTAYSIGWSDSILKDTFEVLFNGKNYPYGDVNMDGVVDTKDSDCIRYYTLYKEYGSIYDNPSASLTPVQKALGGIAPFGE